MDPTSLAALFGGGGAAPAGPATSGIGGAQFGTGWTVSTGGGSAGGLPTWVIVAGLAGLLFYMYRKGR